MHMNPPAARRTSSPRQTEHQCQGQGQHALQGFLAKHFDISDN